ncbi:DNA repair protein REV1-like isoform X2 [Mizuhopecten yessoensis]|uniref:DNA repair protein REV1 n=1 Tax=Mizuhopecten yessoensis TaxID=6573 RepID=A0A210QZD0_MIZYE|nr:DNA repair protein REV1-like isoform X2 [Mizuhopecten yessoensis]OWF54110.1 DNA repair protein REV1 [Mizuhopecten yessoensis]
MSRRGKRDAVSSNTGRGQSRMYTESGWEAQGGYMAAKMQKLQDQNRTDIKPSGETSNIFKGVAIHVNGYTRPSSDELKRLVLIHGGRYEHYLYRTRVTHIIATNLTNSKIKDLMKNGKVVRPEWITDSIKAGRLLSYSQYLLYTNQGGKQKGLETFSTHAVTRHSSTASTMEMVTSYLNKMETSPDNSVSFQSSVDHSLVETENLKSDCDESRRQLNPWEEEESMSDADNDDLLLLDNQDFKKHPPESEISHGHQPRGVIPGDRVAQNVSTADIISPNNIGQSTVVNGHGIPSSKRTGIAKAGEPAFLNEFYSNSRLHHLSTWKSEWRAYVKTLQDQGQDFPGRTKLMEVASRRHQDMKSMLGNGHNLEPKQCGKPPHIIMHVDMDCFFVSVGLRKRPDLQGKPVAVTHSRGQGMKAPIPGSNPAYERQQWELRRNQGGKKGRKRQLPTQQPMLDEGIEEGSEEDDNNDDIDTPQPAQESFHSMAEIASCSYEARQSGVRNGMFMGKAKQLCPGLLTIPYDFEGYQEVSKILYDTVARYTHDIEAVSCDEMLVDCTDLLSITGAEPLEFASLLRQELLEQTGCPASAGMGSNILLAKMATRKAKPNGQNFLQSEDVLDFISDQTIQNIPGVGWSMSKKLKTMNVEKCGDLQKVSLGVLQKEFGPKTGQSLYRYCRGEDDRPIKTEQERKSVSAEINYGIRFKHNGEAEKFLTDLSEEVHTRLTNIDRKGKTITLKVMVRREGAPVETSKFMGHGICNNLSKSVTLPMATDDAKVISKECLGILHNMKVKASDLRGIGIQLQRLEPSTLGGHKSTKGAQSILNFTVSKQASPIKSLSKSPCATVTSSLPNLVDLDIETSTEGHTSIVRQEGGQTEVLNDLPDERDSVLEPKSGDSGNDFLGGYCHNIVDELSRRKTAKRFLPPLPSLPDISGSPEVGTGDGDVGTSGIQDYFPSPSQIDPSVLNELPPDIRRQVEKEMASRRKKDVHRHPANQNTPCSSKSDRTRGMVDERPGCSHWSDNSTNQNDYLTSALEAADTMPSPSQIDPSVLRELPPDIRRQVENDMAIKKRQGSNSAVGFEPRIIGKGHSVSENSSSTHGKESIAELPGCSNWSRQRTNGDHRDNIAIEPLPSLSQLDESCLSALPEELQNEIRQAYVRQEGEEVTRPVLNLQQASSPSKRSPEKTRSPAKSRSPGANRKSPNFKIPRGKPRRGRPKKLEFQTRRQPKITASVGNKQHEFRATILKDSLQGLNIVTADQPAHEVNQGTPVHSDSTTNESEGFVLDGVESTNQKAVNLCGAVTITEVRTLLREWLRLSPVPEDEDEEVMLTYLQDLVVDRNLEQVDLVIKFLNRHIERLQNDLWRATFERIVQHTQCVVLATYDSKLKICDRYVSMTAR